MQINFPITWISGDFQYSGRSCEYVVTRSSKRQIVTTKTLQFISVGYFHIMPGQGRCRTHIHFASTCWFNVGPPSAMAARQKTNMFVAVSQKWQIGIRYWEICTAVDVGLCSVAGLTRHPQWRSCKSILRHQIKFSYWFYPQFFENIVWLRCTPCSWPFSALPTGSAEVIRDRNRLHTDVQSHKAVTACFLSFVKK